MWKRYILGIFCVYVVAALNAQWGEGPRVPQVLFRIEEDHSFSFGSALPVVIALGVLAYQFLIAKRDNWFVILPAVLFVLMWLANLGS